MTAILEVRNHPTERHHGGWLLGSNAVAGKGGVFGGRRIVLVGGRPSHNTVKVNAAAVPPSTKAFWSKSVFCHRLMKTSLQRAGGTHHRVLSLPPPPPPQWGPPLVPEAWVKKVPFEPLERSSLSGVVSFKPALDSLSRTLSSARCFAETVAAPRTLKSLPCCQELEEFLFFR